MKFVFVVLSVLFLVGCSSSDDAATSYKYQISGTAPFSTTTVSPLATAFTIKWNEVNGVVSGIYTSAGVSLPVTGTSDGSGRTLKIAVTAATPTDPARIEIALPAGDLSGSVTATVTSYDENEAVVAGASGSVQVDATTTTTGGGGVTSIDMPTSTCSSGVSRVTFSVGDRLEIDMAGQPAINLCIKASNAFSIYEDPSVTDGVYSLANGSAYFLSNLTATWGNSTEQVKAVLCWSNSDRGTFDANILSEGAASSDTGTFQLYAAPQVGCP